MCAPHLGISNSSTADVLSGLADTDNLHEIIFDFIVFTVLPSVVVVVLIWFVLLSNATCTDGTDNTDGDIDGTDGVDGVDGSGGVSFIDEQL